MTVYEKFYKHDDCFMMKALSEYLSSDTECDDCPVKELCKQHNDISCRGIFHMWLQKEDEHA